jgi:ABC-2 type transport system permease protein
VHSILRTVLIALIRNETLKILRRRRFAIVIAILAAILMLISYAQHRQLSENRNRNWRAELQQRVAGYQNALRRGRISDSWARTVRAEVARLQFYIDHDIEPDKPTTPVVVRLVANVSGWLLPLLVAMLGSDIVSAEHAEGTDKLLLTRPVRRWKVLLSKLITLWMFATLTLLAAAILAWLVSAPILPLAGWNAPMFNGFKLSAGTVSVDQIRQLPLWHDALIAYGLQWFALLTVASISLMLSVIFRSSAAAIGTMLASLIGGSILTRVSPDWTAGKYLFVSALPLADYYSGQAPPYEGMSMMFCILLLAAWAAAATAVAFGLFTRRDVFG